MKSSTILATAIEEATGDTHYDTLRGVTLHYEVDTRSYEKVQRQNENSSSNSKCESFVPCLPYKGDGFCIWFAGQSMAK